MANKITRTTITTEANVIIYDRSEKATRTELITLSGKWTDEKDVLNVANKVLKNDEYCTAIDVESVSISEELREMDLATWMKYSKVVPTEE